MSVLARSRVKTTWATHLRRPRRPYNESVRRGAHQTGEINTKQSRIPLSTATMYHQITSRVNQNAAAMTPQPGRFKGCAANMMWRSTSLHMTKTINCAILRYQLLASSLGVRHHRANRPGRTKRKKMPRSQYSARQRNTLRSWHYQGSKISSPGLATPPRRFVTLAAESARLRTRAYASKGRPEALTPINGS